MATVALRMTGCRNGVVGGLKHVGPILVSAFRAFSVQAAIGGSRGEGPMRRVVQFLTY